MGFRDRLRFGFGSRGVRREAGRRRDARFLCCCGPFSLSLFSFFFVESLVWYEEKISFFLSRYIHFNEENEKERERDAQLYYISRLGRQEFF